LVGEAERRGRRSTERFVHGALNGHQCSETTKHTEPRFRELLTEGASKVELALVYRAQVCAMFMDLRIFESEH
jgi:hypothetical protein